MRVLIYGGSFNPPHLGHLRSVQTAVKALRPDRTLLIPAADPPHKELAAGTPAKEHRLAMAALAAEAIPGCEASDMELRRAGPSYTSDTLRQLHDQYPGAELVFLMGTDMLLTIEAWHEPEVIMDLSSLAGEIRREGIRALRPAGDGVLHPGAGTAAEAAGAGISRRRCICLHHPAPTL